MDTLNINGNFCHEIVAVWKAASFVADPQTAAFKFRYTPVHAANLKYLVLALARRDGAQLPEIVSNNTVTDAGSQIPLREILVGDIDCLAAMARALFLHFGHQHDVDIALGTGSRQLGLTPQVRKRANGIADAARRAAMFFRSSCGIAPSDIVSNWDDASDDPAFEKARVFYNAIKKDHILRGKLSPHEATPESVISSLTPYIEKAKRTGTKTVYDGRVRNLHEMVKQGLVPRFPESLLSHVKPLGGNVRPKAATIPEKEMIRLFPAYFKEDPENANHIDHSKALPGFFNKKITNDIPINVDGQTCPAKNLCNRKTLMTRISHARRYAFRTREAGRVPDQTDFRSYYAPERIKEDLERRVQRFGYANRTVSDEFKMSIMISKYYFGYDIGPLVNEVKRRYIFPSDKESNRGAMAIKMATPFDLLALADGLQLYAASAKKLTEKRLQRGRGNYLIRKGAEVDNRIRIETGLRPGMVDLLEVVSDSSQAGYVPTIYPLPNGKYEIHIPWRWMKQHAKQAFGDPRTIARIEGRDRKQTYVKGYHFVLGHPKTIACLDEYLENWNLAVAVKEKRTRRLLLNNKGEEFNLDYDSTARSIDGIMREVVYFMDLRNNVHIKRVPRYYHRHIMGDAVERHNPGFSLKRAYLTHSFDRGTDWVYGTQDNTMLQEIIQEVLVGLPPRQEQLKQREQEQEERLKDMQTQIKRLHDLLDKQQRHQERSADSTAS